ncbi:hypothetical protein FOZ63_026437, partial [Perkinsus olseni]
ILATCQLLVDISTRRRPLEDSLNARWQQQQRVKNPQEELSVRRHPEDYYPTIESAVTSDHEGDGEGRVEENVLPSRTSAAFDNAEAAVDIESDRIAYADTQTLSRALTLMDEKVKYLTDGGQTIRLVGGTGVDAITNASPTTRGEPPDASGSAPENNVLTSSVFGEARVLPDGEGATRGDGGANRDLDVKVEPRASESTVEEAELPPKGRHIRSIPEDPSEKASYHGDEDDTSRRVEVPQDAGYPIVVSAVLDDHEGVSHHPEDTPPQRGEESILVTTSNDAKVAGDVDYVHDRVPYADTQTLLRVLSLMDEKVKYLTNRDQTMTKPVNEANGATIPTTQNGPSKAFQRAFEHADSIGEASSPVAQNHPEGMGDYNGEPKEGLEVQEGLRALESPLAERQLAEHDEAVVDGNDGTPGASERCLHKGDGEDNTTLRRIEELTRRIVQLEASTVTRPVPNPTGLTGDDVEHPKTLEFDGQTPVASPSHTEEEHTVVPEPLPSHNHFEDDCATELEEVAIAEHEQQRPPVQPTIEPSKVYTESCLPIRIVVDEEISNPNSSLQEVRRAAPPLSVDMTTLPAFVCQRSYTQVQTSQIILAAEEPSGANVDSGESPESNWLVEDDTLVMRDTSMSPELVLEPVVRSPREVREARTTKAQHSSDQGIAHHHSVPVVDTEAVVQLSRLNERIAHLEVTANEVAVKYKEAENRLLRQGYPPILGQPSYFLPSESWVPFPDPRPPASCPALDRDHHQLAIVDLQASGRQESWADQSGATSDSGYDKRAPRPRRPAQPPVNRESLCITDQHRLRPKTPASFRLQMRRSLVRDAKRVAAILRGKDRPSITDDDDDTD